MSSTGVFAKASKARPQAKRAIVLLSGGLDSATVLYVARSQGFQVQALIFDYGQRHRKEIRHAVQIAQASHCPYRMVRVSFPWQGSALLDRTLEVPEGRDDIPAEIPSTYVPARNIIFLSFAASWAETMAAQAIFIGANALDYSGYPDCRPEFFEAYDLMLKKGLKTGVEGRRLRVMVPLLKKTKAQIIRLGNKLGVPYHLTWSCYRGGRRPCGRCDSCVLRARGFAAAKVADPLLSRGKA